MPVAVALGHATDDLVMGRVADASEPTGFEACLRGVLAEQQSRAGRLAEAEVLARSQGLVDRPGRLRAALAWWRAVALGLALVLAVAVAWYLSRRQHPAQLDPGIVNGKTREATPSGFAPVAREKIRP